jgi:hypothetical protein
MGFYPVAVDITTRHNTNTQFQLQTRNEQMICGFLLTQENNIKSEVKVFRECNAFKQWFSTWGT